MRRPDSPAALGLILLIYLGLALATAYTRSPWVDEAWFGSPAWNLSAHGFLGTTILDPASSTWKNVDLTGIDRHTYWVMPLSLLLNSATFRFFGFGSLQMRASAIIFGLFLLLAWRTILVRLHATPVLTLTALLLIAVDYHFQSQAADGRMDAMAAGLGYASLACYLALRERRLPAAVGTSHLLAAASVFTHPNGILLAVLLVITTLYLDAKVIRVKLVALAATPYLVFAAGWGIYVAQDPASFRAQFLGNAAGRGPTITTPLLALKMEIVNRYLYNFGLAPWSSLSGRLNVIPLVILLAGTILCFVSPAIRRHPGWRLLFLWTSVAVVWFTFFEGLKTQFYLIYITPLYCVLTAVAASWLWNGWPGKRLLVAAALIVLVVLQVTRTVTIASRDPKRHAYLPAVRFLRGRYSPADFIMGDGSLMFGLGPDWNLLDDFRLGYNTGKQPRAIVIDDSWTDRIGMLQQASPAIWQHTQRVLSGYSVIYDQFGYRILERRP